jgi:hypothetical protein
MALTYKDLERAKRGAGKLGRQLLPSPYNVAASALQASGSLKGAAPNTSANLSKDVRDLINKRLVPIGVSLPTSGPTPVQVKQAKYRSGAKLTRVLEARRRLEMAEREDKHLGQPGVVPGYTEPDFSNTLDPVKWRVDWQQRGSNNLSDTRFRSPFRSPTAWPAWTQPGGPRHGVGRKHTPAWPSWQGANWSGSNFPDWERQGLARQAGFPDSTGRVWPPEEEALNPYRGKGTDLAKLDPVMFAPIAQGGGVSPSVATWAGWPSVRGTNVGYIPDKDVLPVRSKPTRDELKWVRKAMREIVPKKSGARSSVQQRLKRLAAAELRKRTK